ncbi:MAG: recombinase family protein [Deltaproteobacteria bacterium]|nr:recombinase family protein [Deltaproteobacteria bacterium]
MGEIGHGRISDHRYYGHKQYQGIPFRCAVRRFLAEDAEEAIESHLASIALNPKGLKSVEVAIGVNIELELEDVRKDKERVQTRLLTIDQETTRVFRMLGEMAEGHGLTLVKEQIEALGTEKAALTKRIHEIEARIQKSASAKEAMDNLNGQIVEFKNGWRKGSLAAKKRLLRAIVERMEVRPGVLGVYYLVLSDHCSEESGGKVYRPEFKTKGNSVIPAATFDVDVKNGVTVWSVVEPLWLDFHADIAPPSLPFSYKSKSLESKEKDAISNIELRAKLERLLSRKKRSLEQAAAEVGVSVTTVRRVCRTLGLGRYAPSARRKGVLSRSSQVPFGWVAEHGVLREAPSEMKWVRAARNMRAKRKSYHAIARHFQERGVPTKNGGRWHAKTIYQIFNFNSRTPTRRKGK